MYGRASIYKDQYFSVVARTAEPQNTPYLLVELLEVHVVVDEDAALAEGLDVDAVEGVAHERVAVRLGQLEGGERCIVNCES